jgi:hypothetical protein
LCGSEAAVFHCVRRQVSRRVDVADRGDGTEEIRGDEAVVVSWNPEDAIAEEIGRGDGDAGRGQRADARVRSAW